MSRRAASILVLAVALAVLLTTTAAWAKATPVRQAPVNLTAPSVDGQAVVGSALTANAGLWDGVALKYVYQWYGCDSGGGSCSALGSATSSSYTAASADAGRTVRVLVTASNQNGSTSAASAPSGVTGAPAPSDLATTTNAYYSEHFDATYTNPIWNPDPVAAMSWTSGFAGQALRLTACA